MKTQEPKLTPWNEKEVNSPEKFKVYSPCRINTEDGNGAKPYARGDEVTVFGNTKKDLYFQNKIMYSKDFDAVDAYEKEMKLSFSGKPEGTKETAEAFTGKKK
ncbi:MAG: hypothetical protein WC879_03430 [Melioribacteraceae bacterium]